jgi:hypothetical protein
MFKKILCTLAITALLSNATGQNILADTLEDVTMHPQKCYGELVSQEHANVIYPFTVEIRFYFLDTTNIYEIVGILPNGWSMNNLTMSAIGEHYTGDSIVIILEIMVPDSNNLPFYKQHLAFHIITDTAESNIEKKVLGCEVYFTPYNTIEIWNMEDFANLKRDWLDPVYPAPIRQYINKDSIPVSDIEDFSMYDRDSMNLIEDWWIDNFRTIEVEGLAYKILISPVPYDSLEYYDTLPESPDSVDAHKSWLQIFTGTITGRVLAPAEGGLTVNDTLIGLSGIYIELYDKDYITKTSDYYTRLGKAYTDADGYYSISYSVLQSGEGDYLELHARIYAKTSSTYFIRAKGGGTVYVKRKDIWNIPDEYNGTVNIVLTESEKYSICTTVPNAAICVTEDADAFRAVHWANQAFTHFHNLGIATFNNLRFHIHYKYGAWTNVYTTLFFLVPLSI